MSEKPPSCVLLADRHHGLTEGVRGLVETAFGTVVMVADEASLLERPGRLRDSANASRPPVWSCAIRQEQRGLIWLS
jgi:hypothetical protein